MTWLLEDSYVVPRAVRNQTSNYTRRGSISELTGRGFNSPRLHPIAACGQNASGYFHWKPRVFREFRQTHHPAQPLRPPTIVPITARPHRRGHCQLQATGTTRPPSQRTDQHLRLPRCIRRSSATKSTRRRNTFDTRPATSLRGAGHRSARPRT